MEYQLIHHLRQRSASLFHGGLQRRPMSIFLEAFREVALRGPGDLSDFPLHAIGADDRLQIPSRNYRAGCCLRLQDHVANLTRGPMRALMQCTAEHHARTDPRAEADKNEIPGSISSTGIQ